MFSNNKTSSPFDNTIVVTSVKTETPTHAFVEANSGIVTATAGSSACARRLSNPSIVTVPHGHNMAMNNANVVFATSGVTSATSSCPSSANTGAIPKDLNAKSSKSQRQPAIQKPPPTIETFWPGILSEVRNIKQVDAKHQALPLARIKKIMKLDENAKMIAAEAPLLFAKACEYFIQELSMRAWIHTEESKRRTLQRSDIAQAIANYDQFDFLIDIVPREDIKPSTSSGSSHKKETQSSPSSVTTETSTAAVMDNQNTLTSGVGIKLEQPELINFSTLTSQRVAVPQQLQQLQIIQQATPTNPQQLQYFFAIPNQQPGQPQLVHQLQQQNVAGLVAAASAQQPQQLILTAGPGATQLTATPATSAQQQATLLQNFAQQQQQHQQQQQQHQQIQLLQQVVTPTGEITNVPITINANQLNLLHLQMQQQQPQQQQVVIPTQCLTAQQLLQLGGANALTAGVHNVQHNQQQQQGQQHAHQQHAANTNIFLNAHPHSTTTTQLLTQQQHQQQQQQHTNSIVSTDRNLGSTYRPNC